jgi:phosphoglycerate transport regulatory protein PgtC
MKKTLSKLLGALLLAVPVCAVLAPAEARAGTVTVVTSFPKELTQAYKSAFERANPGSASRS